VLIGSDEQHNENDLEFTDGGEVGNAGSPNATRSGFSDGTPAARVNAVTQAAIGTPLEAGGDDAIFRVKRVAAMRKAFLELDSRERELLARFYVLEQTPEDIIIEMGLTEQEFHFMKACAKATLADSAARVGVRRKRRTV
jgi:hypothetical protein